MSHYRYVHLSDIHFGQEKHGDLAIHEDVRSELLRDCLKLCESYGPASGILVSGDIAYSGQPEQYKIAGDWLDQLTESVGCPQTAVSLVPGNHDVDLSKIGPVTNLIHDKLRSVPVTELDSTLASIGEDKEGVSPLLGKLSAYRQFAERYGCDFKSPAIPRWVKDLPLEAPNKLSFVGMTSVLVSNGADKFDTLVLGSQQYITNRQNCSELVLMMHHPHYWFRDHEKMESYLNRARVIFVGHEHHQRVRPILHEAGETLWIHAGATNPPGTDANYTYRYNWIEFRDVAGEMEMTLEVRIQPRIWDLNATRFETDANLLKGEEFKIYNISCPGFGKPVQEVATTKGEALKSLSASPSETSARENMSVENDPFARLRYLFWKHLDWSERLKVLVEIDILPVNLTQPIPQTMERLALENAAQAGKLKELWDAIMSRIPEDQREANPF